jgi:lambda repressor-like predicted transcriptional regulator
MAAFLKSDLALSEAFAKCFSTYLECSPAMQQIIRDMAAIVSDAEATEDERQAAVATIAEALFPSGAGDLGVDLERADEPEPEAANEIRDAMDAEESTFAERLGTLIAQKGLTHDELASQVGLGQPAISLMLARQCRPQRHTVKKIAQALGVKPEELWPGFEAQ